MPGEPLSKRNTATVSVESTEFTAAGSATNSISHQNRRISGFMNTMTNQINNKELLEKSETFLQKAKIQILVGSAFFSTIMLSIDHRITTKVPTAGTDGKTIYYNPNFLESITHEQCIGLILHELYHVAMLHIPRQGDRKHSSWNEACDYTINNELDRLKHQLPANGLLDHSYDDMTAEKVYDLIKDDKSIGSKSKFSNDLLPPPEGVTPEELATEIGELIIRAEMISKLQRPGEHIPGEISRKIEELTNPSVEWNVLLLKYMEDFSSEKSENNWSRPSRRHQPDFYLPTQHEPTIKHLVVALDLSGSVSDDEVRTQLTEVEHLRNIYTLEKLTLYGVDTRIRTKIVMSPSDSLLDMANKYGLKGGGGTAFNSFFTEIEKDPPSVLIFFSDLGVSFNFPKPSFDTIWVNTWDKRDVPKGYGKTIHIKI